MPAHGVEQLRLWLRRVHQAEEPVVRRDGDAATARVEGQLVARVGGGLHARHLLHHAHVPQAHDAVCVGRGDGVAAVGKRDRVDGVLVAVERLDAEAGAAVPHRDRLVARAGADVVGEGLEADGVDRVDVAAEGGARLASDQVPELGRVVHRARDEEVAHVVVRNVPHRLRVLAERRDAAVRGKIPDLDRAVRRSGRQA
eukprot:2706939-Pleurochrysis_carterae.AAC.11